ncbi:MAG: hypothetical protein LC642_08250 [Verrucomicrobiaceae bacterium]|nr:hypothetical protein [Verrucomicrobiaceae bacterium]
MIDLFALLEQPRRPWLDEHAVKEAFHRLAFAAHPDQPGGQSDASADLNAAFVTLRDPVKRLRHFLELEDPTILRQPGSVPDDLGELFPRVAAAREALTRFAERRRNAASAVARALLAEEEGAAKTIAHETRGAIEKRLAADLDALRAIDGGRISDREGLAHLYARLAYLTRWDAQLREAALQCEIG